MKIVDNYNFGLNRENLEENRIISNGSTINQKHNKIFTGPAAKTVSAEFHNDRSRPISRQN
jgi:hypothetical protein